jgi:hypothetical protein
MNANYGHICTALLEGFPATTNFSNYNSVHKNNFCNLNPRVPQTAPQI